MGIILVLGLAIVFKPLQSIKFYGFEYEDSFISSHVSSQENLIPFIKEFRTQGCESRVNGKCISVSSYTGHYVSYSAYLFTVAKIFDVQNQYLIHKFGNALLFGLCFLLIFVLYKDNLLGITLMFSFISCLPVVYVLNSGLIENLSFCVALIFILSLHQHILKRNKLWLWVSFALLLLLVVVKRENLIYLSTLILINPKSLARNLGFLFFIFCLILSQYIINPFYTEGLEANYLGRSTFSIDYFIFQFPTYLVSFFRFDGFFILLIFILLSKKPSKNSLILISIWLAFIILYSFHYRGQYAIEAGKITHFESFRYMFNTLPLLIGYMIFGKKNNNQIFKNIVYPLTLIMCLFLTFNNFDMLKEFGREEFTEYHSVNKKIDLLPKGDKKIAIHDNFVLISMLNSNNKLIDIISAQKNYLEFHKDKENILINRFDIIDIDSFNEVYEFELIDELSSNGVKVYYFKECF
ncbi:hypothetical protein [Meridianimaribacter flavus]|uniref:Glycosyltransferase RgtA/B/C/D-like domain-containing protein n=1 Tax=Meridianimaribacter flavus TaxID=571115 RepID=A0ABY2G721_9FLAO|nr:hypothetical protein [Meridianimaribacter flavus]TDY12304.1 hypothetical protein A8975_1067 [Meridianimaribacter flavus]